MGKVKGQGRIVETSIHSPDRIALPLLVDLGVNPHIHQFF